MILQLPRILPDCISIVVRLLLVLSMLVDEYYCFYYCNCTCGYYFELLHVVHVAFVVVYNIAAASYQLVGASAVMENHAPYYWYAVKFVVVVVDAAAAVVAVFDCDDPC